MKKNNKFNSTSETNKIKKPEIKVNIIYSNQKNNKLVYKYTDSDGKDLYSGFLWDIWSLLKEYLKDKYEFNITYNDNEDMNKYVQQTADGEYDIVIGQFLHSKKFEKIIAYTQPILINANIILHFKKESALSNIWKLIYNSRHIFLTVIIIGFIAGLALYLFDKHRSEYLPQVSNAIDKSKAKFFRAMQTGVAAMFGELGFLTENARTGWKSFILTIIISCVSFIIIAYTQGVFVANIITGQEKAYYNVKNKPKNPCLSLQNSVEGSKISRFGIEMKYYENMSLDDLLNIYMKNQKTYDGVVTNYIDGMRMLEKYSNLTMSKNFGAEPVSFIINQNLHNFIEDVNQSIVQLKEGLTLNNSCTKYFSSVDGLVCSLS